jgi:uncharacterized protein (TIGR03437 family)
MIRVSRPLWLAFASLLAGSAHAGSSSAQLLPAFNFTATLLSGAGSLYVSDVAVADINGDGVPDIVAASSSSIVVYIGDGTGHFGSPIKTTLPSAVRDIAHLAVGDFNGDGKLDVAIAAGLPPNTQSASVWFGRGDGTFSQGPGFAIPGVSAAVAASVAVADFNGDGFADLAIGHGPTPTVSVRLSNGDGTFKTPIEYSLSGDEATVLLATADANRDGAVDLIAVTAIDTGLGKDNRIHVLLGRGDGTFLQPAGWADDVVKTLDPPSAIAVGDLNGDHVPDLVIQNSFSEIPYRCSVTAMVGNGDGTFQPPTHYDCSLTSQASASGWSGGVVIADFTGDGKADIAALTVFDQGYLHLFPGNGDGTFQAASVYQYQYTVTYLSAMAVADFNGDGRLDLAVGNLGSISILAGAPGPALRIAMTHTGTLTFGQNQTYTIAVSNAPGASPSDGAVSVTIPAAYNSIVSWSGTGWNCASISCTRSDTLAGGSSYPNLTVQINVYGHDLFSFALTHSAVLSGGGSPPAESIDAAPITGPGATGMITSVNTVGAITPSFFPPISPNDWIEIHGVNLVPSNTPASGVTWSNAPEFASGRMPTQLGGVSVTVNGNPAYVYFYCSAATSPVCKTDQINVLTPVEGLSTSVSASIVVTSSLGTFSFLPDWIAETPSFLRFGGSRYVAATHTDYSLLGPSSLYPGLSTPAKAGEVVVLWAAGFGLPTTTLAAGSSSQYGGMPETPVCTVSGYPATVWIALVSPGLYQLDLTVPTSIRSGDNPVTCIYGGAATPDGALLAAQ